jgi:hypothetical protein
MIAMVNECFRLPPNRENFAGCVVKAVQIAARADCGSNPNQL